MNTEAVSYTHLDVYKRQLLHEFYFTDSVIHFANQASVCRFGKLNFPGIRHVFVLSLIHILPNN